MTPRVQLEFTRRTISCGAFYNPGDRASFTPDEAVSLVRRFPDNWFPIPAAAPEAVPKPDGDRKALSAPLLDKMQHRAPLKKGFR